MIREVNLASYLPPFMAEYKQVSTALNAETPEFRLVWEAADRTLKNEFIANADEYGISRFESILGILPSKDDTLESRRARVQARWFTFLPYTWRMLLERLAAICGESNFFIFKNFLFYEIQLEVCLCLYGQIEELERLLGEMIPCNMVINTQNRFPCVAEGALSLFGGICVMETFFVTNDSQEKYMAGGRAEYGGGMTNCTAIMIANDFNEQINIYGVDSVRAGTVAVEFIEVKNED